MKGQLQRLTITAKHGMLLYVNYYKLDWSTNFNFFFLARTSTTDSYRVWAADSESVLRFAPSHQVFQLFDILYLSMLTCIC